jgi:hypothetical protein
MGVAKARMNRAIGLATLALCLTACKTKEMYRCVERTDKYVDANGNAVASGDSLLGHDEVHVVLKHGGSKIHAMCDLSTVDHLDENATCGLRPLRNYDCEVGKDSIHAKGIMSDLVCNDSDGRSVYLYVSKEE